MSAPNEYLLDLSALWVYGAPTIRVEYIYEPGYRGHAPSLFDPGSPEEPASYWPTSVDGEEIGDDWVLEYEGETMTIETLAEILFDRMEDLPW